MKEIWKKQGLLAVKLLLASLGIMGGYTLYRHTPTIGRGLSDGISIAGVLMILTGIYRMVSRGGMFDKTRYHLKKMFVVAKSRDREQAQADFPDFEEYRVENPYRKVFLPFFLVSIIDFALSFWLIVF